MKTKILFFTMLFMASMSLMSFLKVVQATWVSTCGHTHVTTFTGEWTETEMAYYIGEFNADDCGNYPGRVTFN